LTVRFGADLPLKAAITASSFRRCDRGHAVNFGIDISIMTRSGCLSTRRRRLQKARSYRAVGIELAGGGSFFDAFADGVAVDGDGVAVETSSWTSPDIPAICTLSRPKRSRH
jgi:hypothetical protein